MNEDDRQDETTMTRHGPWTPEVSEQATREMQELANEHPDTEPVTRPVDKRHLNAPARQPGTDEDD